MDPLRARLRSVLQVAPVPPPPEVREVERHVFDGFTRSLIRYDAPDGDRIEALLFEPAARRSQAAVLALHQHNSQWSIGKSEIAGLAGDPCQAFGPALAQRGVTVLAPDAIGFESRTKSAGWGTSLAPPLAKPLSTAEGWLQYYNEMAHRLVQGDLLIRKLLDDCAVGLSVLQSSTSAAPGRLGVAGHSFGGHLALFLAALDTRVGFACASGAVCSLRHKLTHGTGLDMSLVIPGFARQFDIGDLIGCVAPRPLLVVSADADPNTADAEALVRGADHVCHLRVAGGHALDRQRFDAIVEWLDREGRD